MLYCSLRANTFAQLLASAFSLLKVVSLIRIQILCPNIIPTFPPFWRRVAQTHFEILQIKPIANPTLTLFQIIIYPRNIICYSFLNHSSNSIIQIGSQSLLQNWVTLLQFVAVLFRKKLLILQIKSKKLLLVLVSKLFNVNRTSPYRFLLVSNQNCSVGCGERLFLQNVPFKKNREIIKRYLIFILQLRLVLPFSLVFL